MTGSFVAVDVETANSRRDSICQIGLVAFADGELAWSWSSLVNPECEFDGLNVGKHGIASHCVKEAPTWPVVLDQIAASIQDQVVVSHTRFDCDAMHHASYKYGLEFPPCSWLDNCEVARIAWPDFPKHTLDALCERMGIHLEHHSAASDARACCEVFRRAMSHTGMGIKEWMARTGLVTPADYTQTESPPRMRFPEKITGPGHPAGPLSGNALVCTGDFSIGKAALVEMAQSLGFNVMERITKNTMMLIVGHRDLTKYPDQEKSRKLVDAEAGRALN